MQAAAAIFFLHGVFTATFLVLPPLLVDAGIAKANHWWLYLPANLVALCFMRVKATPHPLNFGISYLLLAVGTGLLAMPFGTWWLLFALSIYFIAFYRLETGLPHWVAHIASPDARGRAMGLYSSAQFLGSFCGGAVAGRLWHNLPPATVLLPLVAACACAALLLLKIGKTTTLRAATHSDS